MNTKHPIDLGIGGCKGMSGSHICYIFSNDEERLDLLSRSVIHSRWFSVAAAWLAGPSTNGNGSHSSFVSNFDLHRTNVKLLCVYPS